MKSLSWILFSGLLALIQLPLGKAAAPSCPLIGPEFPPPQRLSQHPIWGRALANLDDVFNYIDQSSIKGINEVSCAIQDTPEVKQVDGNTVFQLGSVSNIFAVVAFLAEAGDVYWNYPITRFIPELANFVGRTKARNFGMVRETAWDDITLGALASQVYGLGRDFKNSAPPIKRKLRLLRQKKHLIPGRWEFLEGVARMYPSYPPWQTATHSDVGFQLLAYALENISGKKYTDILDERIIKPLQLNCTYLDYAPASVGIMDGLIEDSYWDVSLGDANPSGNMYSSANDLSTLGRESVSSKLIKPSITCRWLNPVTFGSELRVLIGAPWGVRCIQLDPWRRPHSTLTMFTKAGTFRKYTAFLSLLWDFNIGFATTMASLVANTLYGGIYCYNGTAGYSWLVITTNPGKPGLGVGPWISNGVDMISTATKLQSGASRVLGLEARLYYSQLESRTADGGKRQAWKAVYEDTGGFSPATQLFLPLVVLGLPLDEFIFNFDSSGKVVSVENLAQRVKLLKLKY
ncbi:beta-lactamase/transpeptidase-like protein [Phaeosphaeriaceae sp. PMI808]|nr:beta-lactamase/transpeptidase-like protein [Phaeosphaeriaceae sp. PMI808]